MNFKKNKYVIIKQAIDKDLAAAHRVYQSFIDTNKKKD